VLGVPDGLVDALAERVADALVERLPEPVQPYMTVEHAAEYLACPKSRVYELVQQRRVKHYRDGRRLLFRREDLDAVLRVEEVE
jgi:excisionase family DNA binding protein